MVKELKEGHLYELQSYMAVASKNEIHLKYDNSMGSSAIYLYLDHCPYSEVHALLELKNGRIVYTTDQEHLLFHSREVMYNGKKIK